MRFGPDALGARHYQRALLRSLKPGSAVGIFLHTFGKAHRTVDALCKSKKVADLVVHIAPFDRTHKYPIKQHMALLRREAKWLEKMAVQYPHIKIYPSPFCEQNHPASRMKPVFDELQALAPHCTMLNSIWKGDVVPGVVTEIHLENSKPRKKPAGEYTVSFDGFGGSGSGDFTDADVPSILARYADAIHIRAWDFRFNGRYGNSDPSPVDKRKHWPDEKYIRSRMACCKVREGTTTWPASQLWKPCADDHGALPPTKDNKAMCILTISVGRVRVFDRSGNKIDEMKRAVPDHTGDPRGARYYSGKHQYEIGDIAEKNTGSRLIRVENSPLTDADLRSGRFK